VKKTIAIGVCLAALAIGAEEKRRVFVTQSDSWQMKGRNGGAAPQTAEIIKTFGERCQSLTVTSNKDKADYVVTLDHEGGKGWALKDTKVAVFNKDGDVIYSGSTRSLGGGVKDACSAILKAGDR
jgi:hypothetical protein